MDDRDRSGGPPPLPDDRVAEFLARMKPAPGERTAAGPCPEPVRLAGFVEGRLLDRERGTVEAHLAACGECRASVADIVAGETGVGLEEPVRPVARRWILLRPAWIAAAAAASVLAAFALWGGRGGRPSPAGTAERLVAAARDLAAARPDLFGGFAPLGPGESLPAALAQMRGGTALLAPAGKTLPVRPSFRWEPAPGVALWRVTLMTDEGDPIWSAESKEPLLPFPAGEADLRAGTRYIWGVSGDGPLGPEGARRAFDVASAEERRAFEEAGGEIDARVPERVRSLVRAHWAIRRGLYAAAEEDAARFLVEDPADPVGRETLATARKALGVPETDGGGR